MKRVLILCTGNSCRSQMAEVLWKKLGDPDWEAFSAGSQPAGYVHPLAIEALHEIGIDTSHCTSKSAELFRDKQFDLVVTVCDHAKEACPVFPGAKQTLHWPFEDPAHAIGDDATRMAVFCRVRDEIRHKICEYLSAGAGANG